MRIAFVLKLLNPCSSSRAPMALANELKLKHQLLLIGEKSKADLFYLNRLKQRGVKIVLLAQPKNFIGSFLNLITVYQALKEFQPQVISFHSTTFYFLAAKLTGFPLIKTYYGTQMDAYKERVLPHQKSTFVDEFLNFCINQYVLLTEKVQFYLADKIVAISRYTQHQAKRLFRKKIPYIYLGATPLKPFYSKFKTLKNNSFLILSVSRFTPYKGFHRLLKISNRLLEKKRTNWQLILAGYPEKKSYLQYLYQLKNNHTTIIPNPSDKKLAQLYQACDLYLTADYNLFFGLPILEAAFFAKPTLALNYAAAKELILHGQTGFIANNEKQLYQYLDQLLGNKSLRLKLGLKAQKRARKDFRWSKTASHYEKIFKQFTHF